MRILCTADVHVGRSSRCDGEINCQTAALCAWERIVDQAIEGRADVVVIAGDLYDGLPAQYATRPRVRAAFERLRTAGIPALAVAGNHDHDALPDFRQAFGDLVYVFGSGCWEQRQVGGVQFVGRSFAGPFENESLLGNFQAPAGGITVGILHADVNAQSRYGPTPLEQFSGRGVAAWVVGHVHIPRVYNGGPPVAYPGSPQALDWGETGAHGFRWLTIGNGHAAFSDVQPVSTVRYEYVEIELAPGEALESKLADRAATCRRDHGCVESVRFRVDVRLRDGARLQAPEGMVDGNGFAYVVRSTVDAPSIALDAEASQSDARGQAARLLLGLQGHGEPRWQQEASRLVETVSHNMGIERVNLHLPDDEALDSLRTAAPDEARLAIQRVLERILSASAEGGA